MRVRVEAGSIDHELHGSGRPSICWIILVGAFGGTTLELWVNVGVVPVDVTAVCKAADNDDVAFSGWLSRRIPSPFLHGEYTRIIEPATLSGLKVGSSRTGVEDTNCFSAVVILIQGIIRGRALVVEDRANVSAFGNSSVSTECHKRTVGKVHPRRAKHVRLDVLHDDLVCIDIPR